MHRPGVVMLPSAPDISSQVLLDPGALHSSYMSETFYLTNKTALEPFSSQGSGGSVRLGGTSHVKPILRTVRVLLSLEDPHGDLHTHFVNFGVFDTQVPLILGAPDLLQGFKSYFIKTFEAAAAMRYPTQPHVAPLLEPNSKRMEDFQHLAEMEGYNGEEIELQDVPWAGEDLDEAPEDTDLPYPGDFFNDLPHLVPDDDSDTFCFVEPTQDYIKAHFTDQFESRCTPEFYALCGREIEETYVKVFVPHNWDGIKDVVISIKIKPELQDEFWSKPRRAKVRPINPKLLEQSRDEITRLCSYFYRPSSSRISSPMTVAKKVTPPYIRVCTDTSALNRFFEVPSWPIPDPQDQIRKAALYIYYTDLDMTNGFHQLRVCKFSSELLSVATIFGQFEPCFLPEGVAPASYYLHYAMIDIAIKYGAKIGQDILEWTIIIFDNILVCANTLEELRERTLIVLDMCAEYNVFLKLAKSAFGLTTVKFFGYEVRHNSYGLCEDRLTALQTVPLPTTTKEAQSVAGSFLFCGDFVENYSTLAAPLYDMTAKKFDWKQDLTPYEEAFVTLKDAVLNSIRLFTPDYSADWVARFDASDKGCSGVLYQLGMVDGVLKRQVLSTFSHKWSGSARNWDTINKEATGIYLGMKAFEQLISVKEIDVETDHANLQFIHSSSNPRIIRQKHYLQRCLIRKIRHIKGRDMHVADLLSRVNMDDLALLIEYCMIPEIHEPDELHSLHNMEFLTPEEMFDSVHGGRVGHWAAPEVWKRLNKLYPGHSIPYRTIDAFVRACPTCQKERLNQRYFIDALVKTHKRLRFRSTIGADLLEVVRDAEDFKYILTISNFFTKRCRLFKVKDKTAESLARSVFIYITQHGLFDEFRSDPGSDLTSDIFAWLLKWLGIKHTFTLVHRPQGSNIEGTNSQIMRHLRHLVFDERLHQQWSSDHVLPLIEWIINTHWNREVGGVPLHLDWGNLDTVYSNLPDDIDLCTAPQKAQAFASKMKEVLTACRESSAAFMAKLDQERRTLETPNMNKYQPGDLIRKLNTTLLRPDKLYPKWLGPYKVILHTGNDVECASLVRQLTFTFHVSDLELWVGTEAKAIEMAQIDDHQFQIDEITSHTGDPMKRTSMTFCVHYADGDVRQKRKYDQDLAETQQFETYCRSFLRWELRPLLYPAKTVISMVAQWRKETQTHLELDDEVYVKLQGVHGMQQWDWYASLDLPDFEIETYYVLAKFTRFAGPKHNLQKAMCFHYPALNLKLEYYLDWIYLWARAYSLPDGCTLVDEAFVKMYPQVLRRPSSKAAKATEPKALEPTSLPPPTQPRKVSVVAPAAPAVPPRIRASPYLDVSTPLDAWGYPISRKKAARARPSEDETQSS